MEMMVWRNKVKVKKVRWEEKEKDCVGKEGVGVKEGDCRWEGKKETRRCTNKC